MWPSCRYAAARSFHTVTTGSSCSMPTGLSVAESSAMAQRRASELFSLRRNALMLQSIRRLHVTRHRQQQSMTEERNIHIDVDDVEAVGPSRKARTTRSQKTMKVTDLPTHASDVDGQPMKPLQPIERNAGTTKTRKKSSSKKVDAAPAKDEHVPTTAAGSSAVSNPKTHPRIDELGPNGQVWPPLAKDVLNNMARFSTCILLTRVGGFYESYFEQAPVLASLLGIKLASRTWGGRTIAMAGFPIVQIEKYLKILVMDHRRLVAICDEFKEIKSGSRTAQDEPSATRAAPVHKSSPFASSMNGKLGQSERIEISRRVTRVVSPGTLIDETFLDPFASNWIVSISKVGSSFGVAWLDVSTADFNTTVCSDEQSLRDEVARIGPSEVVLERGVFNQRSDDASSENGANEPSILDVSYQAGDFGRSAQFLPNESPLWEAIDPSTVHVSFIGATSNATLDNDAANQDPESAAVANLTAHLKTRLIDVEMDGVEDLTGQQAGPDRRRRDRVLTMDASTLSALEINASMRRDEQTYNPLSMTLSARGSLLSHVRRTVTKGGARLLAQWLTAPSTSITVIHRRQALVALFLEENATLTEDLRNMLRRRAGDISRALQRILTSRNDEQDLLEVRDFTHLCSDTVSHLRLEIEQHRKAAATSEADEPNPEGWKALESVVAAFEDLGNLGRRLGEAIDEDVIAKRLRAIEDRAREVEADVLGQEASAASADESRIVRRKPETTIEDADSAEDSLWGARFEHLIHPGASPQLTALTREHLTLRRKAYKLEADLRKRFSDRLSLRFLLGQGYIVHLSDVRETMQKTLTEMEKEMNMAYKSKTTRTFYHEQFTRIGSRLGRVELELQEKEMIELQRLRLEVLVELGRLRRNASLLHELDVLIGFSTLAKELNLVRPTVTEGREMKIKDGRHIGVELALLHQQRHAQLQFGGSVLPDGAAFSRRFTPNDIVMDTDSKLHLITGPNMGGKSTLLRMVAIIAILAQTGSFVPASSCQIGIIDQIFSRIGAHDAIHADKSTFMVEMLEVGQFLRRSTDRSLVLCDEVGRGTDHQTGIAIAHATAMHLVEFIGCKCLFATHLHNVGDMLRETQGVDFYCTDLEETPEGDVVFSHKLRAGLNRTSHGLAIARLANLPEDVLERAKLTLTSLQEKRDSERSGAR